MDRDNATSKQSQKTETIKCGHNSLSNGSCCCTSRRRLDCCGRSEHGDGHYLARQRPVGKIHGIGYRDGYEQCSSRCLGSEAGRGEATNGFAEEGETRMSWRKIRPKGSSAYASKCLLAAALLAHYLVPGAETDNNEPSL